MSCYELKSRKMNRNSLIYKAVLNLYNLANNLEKRINLSEHIDSDYPHIDSDHYDVPDTGPHIDVPHLDNPPDHTDV